MGLFKKVKVWWKRHVVPDLSGRMEEVEKQLKETVANQKQSDARIAELETKVQEQILRNERVEAMLRACIITLGEIRKCP
jgi:chaperonin cofactor prefoldin